MADSIAMMRENIKVMNVLDGFDVVIICCSSEFQAEYWQTRLENGRGSILSSTSIVLAVQEDWPGGAGNGKIHPALYNKIIPFIIFNIVF